MCNHARCPAQLSHLGSLTLADELLLASLDDDVKEAIGRFLSAHGVTNPKFLTMSRPNPRPFPPTSWSTWHDR